jgi:hypothetical protein
MTTHLVRALSPWSSSVVAVHGPVPMSEKPTVARAGQSDNVTARMDWRQVVMACRWSLGFGRCTAATTRLARLSHHGDLDQVASAVDRLDAEGKRIIDNTMTAADKLVGDTVNKLTEQLTAEDGPLAGLFDHFNPAMEGNVIDAFRDLVSSTIVKATKQSVTDMAESTKEQVESFTSSVGMLEKVAAIEAARLEEAKRGTAKGRDHEHDVESLLGDLVVVAGDGLDDVSDVPGLDGSKKGDKVIRPRGGVAIVTEEKWTKPVSEAKARMLLDETMRNRGAALGMLIVDDETKVPGNQPYHLIDDDKVVVGCRARRLAAGVLPHAQQGH